MPNDRDWTSPEAKLELRVRIAFIEGFIGWIAIHDASGFADALSDIIEAVPVLLDRVDALEADRVSFEVHNALHRALLDEREELARWYLSAARPGDEQRRRAHCQAILGLDPEEPTKP